MSTIQIKNLTFGYDQRHLFEGTNLTLESQWKLGLVGRNGRGKTTLFKILMGQLPYTGKVQHALQFQYFPAKIKDSKQLTYYALNELQDFEFWQIKKEFQLLGMEEEQLWQPFCTLSGGEQTKALLALLFLNDENYPLIDEPTNHLDIKTRKQVIQYLKQKKQGYILVSHDQTFMDEVVDHILSIEKNQLVLYQGNYQTYLTEKKQRDQFEINQNEKIIKDITRLKQTAAEKAQWSNSREKDKQNKPGSFVSSEARNQDKGAIGADAARAMKRSKSIVKRMGRQIEEKETLLKNIEYVDPLAMNYETTHHKRLVQAENLSLAYQDRVLFQQLSFEVNVGDRIAFVGPNGTGKSSVLAAICQQFSGEKTGNLQIASNLPLSLIRQDYHDNTGTLQEFAEKNKLPFNDLLNNLHKLGMERDSFQTPIEKMSMGQQKKVEMAKSLCTTAALFIWDEPLNYLDLFNRQQIEEVLLRVKPTLIFVEHDQQFIEKVATKVIQIG